MSNIKNLLKEAKEAIDAKDYERAIELLKDVEEKNYNIYLFLGLSYANIDMDEDTYKASEDYYKKALELQSNSPFPIRGLVDLYTKAKIHDKLCDSLKLLIPLTTDLPKKKELQKKLLEALELSQRHREIVELVKGDLLKETEDGEEKIRLLSRLEAAIEGTRLDEIRIMSETKMKEQGIPILNPAKAHVIGAPKHTPEQKMAKDKIDAESEEAVMAEYSKANTLGIYSDLLAGDKIKEILSDETLERINTNYIKVLSLLRRFSADADMFRKYTMSIHSAAVKMHAALPQSTYPLERLIEESEINSGDINNLHGYSVKLTEISPSRAGLGWIGLGYHSVVILRDYSDNSKSLLDKGLAQLPQSIFGNVALAKWYLKNTGAIHSSEVVDRVRGIISKIQPVVQSKETQISVKPIGPFYSTYLVSLELILSKSLIKNFEYEQCSRHLTSVLNKYPNQPLVMYQLGKIQFKLSNYTSSKETFSQLAAQTDLDTKIRKNSLVYVAWINSILGVELEESTKILQGLEESALQLYVLGCLEKKQGKPREAIQSFLKSAKLNSNFSETFSELGDLYSSADPERSKKCYQRAISLNPSNKEAGIALSEIYLKASQVSLAIALYKEITDHCLSNTKQFQVNILRCNWAFYRLALFQMDNAQLDESIHSFLSAIKGSPNDSIYWRGLGEAYRRQNKYIAALKALKKAEELITSPTPELHFQIASLYMILGEHSDSIVEFDLVLKIIPDHIPSLKSKSDALFHLSKESFKSKSYRHALHLIDQAEKSVKLGLESAGEQKVESLFKLLGDISTFYNELLSESEEFKFNRMEKLKQGCNAYLKLFEIHSHSAHNLQDLSLSHFYQYNLSTEKEERDNLYKTSIKFITQAINLEPTDSKLWNILGVILMDRYPAQSQHALIKSAHLSSSKPDAFNNLALLYLRYGFISMADKSLIIAKSNDTSSPRSWTIQGILHEIESGVESAFNDYSHCSIALESSPLGEALLGYAISNYHHHQKTQSTDLLNASSLSASTSSTSLLELSYSILYKYLELYPESIEAHLYFSMILENLSNLKESEFHLSQSIKLLQQSSKSGESNLFNYNSPSISQLKINNQSIPFTIGNAANHIKHQDKLNFVILNLSRIQYRLGKYKESIEGLNQVNTSKGSIYESIKLEILGVNYSALGKFDDSINSFKQSIASLTKEVESTRKPILSLSLARVLYKKNQSNPGQILSNVEELILKNKDQESICFLSSLYTTVKQYDKAIQHLTQYLQKDPSSPLIDVFKLLSQISLVKGDINSARSYLLRSCHMYPNESRAWTLLSDFQIQYFGSENIENLPLTLLSQVESSENEINCTYSLAKAQLSGIFSPYAQSIQRSINFMKKLVHLYPSNIYYTYCLMSILYMKSLYTNNPTDFLETKASMEIIDGQINNNEDLDEKTSINLTIYKSNRDIILLDIAISENNDKVFTELSERLLKSSKGQQLSNIHRTIAKYYYQKSDTSKSIEHLKESLKLDPKNIQSYYDLSHIYQRMECYDASLLCANKSLEMVDPSDTNSLLNSQSRVIHSMILLKKYREALKLLESFSTTKESSLMLLLRGLLLLLINLNPNPNNIKQYTNDMKSTVQILGDSITKNPHLSLSHYYLTIAHINLKSYKGLESLLQSELSLSDQLKTEISQLLDKIKPQQTA